MVGSQYYSGCQTEFLTYDQAQVQKHGKFIIVQLDSKVD